jgi:hypothetical protein
VKVTIDPDKDFLNQVLCLLTISDSAIYEVQEPCLISLDQLRNALSSPARNAETTAESSIAFNCSLTFAPG